MDFPTCPARALTGVTGPAGGEVLVLTTLVWGPARCLPCHGCARSTLSSSTPSYWSKLGAGHGHCWHHGDVPRVAPSHGGQHLGHVMLCPDILKSSWKRGKEKHVGAEQLAINLGTGKAGAVLGTV